MTLLCEEDILSRKFMSMAAAGVPGGGDPSFFFLPHELFYKVCYFIQSKESKWGHKLSKQEITGPYVA